jgi:hypothetical protein
MNTFVIFDNGGITVDRYTIINHETGDVYAAGENPDAPIGMGKFCGNCADHRIVMYGAGWRQKLPGKKVIRTEVDNYINNARLDPEWLGKEVKCIQLPMPVQRYISNLNHYSHGHEASFSPASIVYIPGDVKNVLSGEAKRVSAGLEPR